jgi:hypothetical protein
MSSDSYPNVLQWTGEQESEVVKEYNEVNRERNELKERQ